MKSVLDSIHCTPSRRPVKFVAGAQSCHYLVFDPAISRDDRLLLFMEIFSFYKLLVDPTVVSAFEVATYLPEELVEIRIVTDPRHPAYGQAGLYAKRQIAANTIVTPYTGLVEIFGTSCNSRTYTMGFGSISDDYALDAEFCGNYGRFANDPRGVEGLSANLSAESRFNSRGESFTALVARRQISEGEEILMAYGKAHSLSASLWTGVRGELLMRRREGGLLPLPRVVVDTPFTTASTSDVAQQGGSEGVATASPPTLTARTGLSREVQGYDVMWECAQCGTWNCAMSPSMVNVERCSGCATCKLSGTKMVAMLSTTPSTAARNGPPSECGADQRHRDATASPNALANLSSVPLPHIPAAVVAAVGAECVPSPVDACLLTREEHWCADRRAAAAGGPVNNGGASAKKNCSSPLSAFSPAATLPQGDNAPSASLAATGGSKGGESSPPPPLTPVVSAKRSHKKKTAYTAANNAAAGAVPNGGGSAATSAGFPSAPAVATRVATLSPCPSSTSPCSSSSPTYSASSPTFRGGGLQPGSPSGHGHHHHHPSYAAERCDWPMNVPFLPWQIWDPSVPVAALEKHSRFDSHEHVFLYAVEVEEDDESDSETDSEGGSEEGEGRCLDDGGPTSKKGTALANGASAEGHRSGAPSVLPAAQRAADGETKGPPPTVEGRQEEDEGSQGLAAASPDGVAGKELTAVGKPAAPVVSRNRGRETGKATEAHGQRRRKKARPDLWEKQGSDELSAVLLSRPPMSRRRQKAKLSAHKMDGGPGKRTAWDGTSGAGRNSAADRAATLATEEETYIAPVPLLSRSLGFHRDRERFVLLHTCLFQNASLTPSAASRDSNNLMADDLPATGPLECVREALRSIRKRPFTSKSFQPGDTVAFFGGCIRPLRDIRCRPEHSPLVIPLIYLLPTALRRKIARRRRHGVEAETNGVIGGDVRLVTEQSAELDDGGSDIVDAGLQDLQDRLAQLCLVVTNDMMFCPVLAEAIYTDDADGGPSSSLSTPKEKEEEGETKWDGDGSEREGDASALPLSIAQGERMRSGTGCTPDSERRIRTEVPQWKEEAGALLRACNVALVLTLDALGSPHVIAVATKHISSFEPLLARVQ